MAIILPQDHPAYARLKSQGIPVKSTTGDAFRQGASGIDEITLGFVNVMPTVYLEETVDLLLARLAYAKQDVRPIFISPEQKPAKGVAWAEAHGKVDALLFTGYAASDKQFHELDFWPEFQEIVNDAVAEELPVFGVCAGAMAVSYQAYGIAKEQAAHKLLGNYDYKTADGRSIYLATSRHNTLNRDNLLQAVKEQGLEILLETQDTPQRNRAFWWIQSVTGFWHWLTLNMLTRPARLTLILKVSRCISWITSTVAITTRTARNTARNWRPGFCRLLILN